MRIKLCVGLFLILSCLKAYSQEGNSPTYIFNNDSLNAANGEISSYPKKSPSGLESIYFKPVNESIRFGLPGYDEDVPYRQGSYLVIDVEHTNSASLIVILEFTRKGDKPDQNGWIHSRISARLGVLPNLPTRLVFPLSYLDAQQIFLPKMPRQLKGTISGNRLDARDIDKVFIRIKNTSKSFPQDIFINGIYIFENLPPELPELQFPLVDSLGQWNAKKWKGKPRSFEYLKKEIGKDEISYSENQSMEGRSGYMGFKELRFDSTGFFHTHDDGSRWWMVDPEGYAYLSIAPTGVRAFSHGPVEKNEDLFEWLPPEDGLFGGAYARQRGLKSLSFITINLMRLWGDDYSARWLNHTRNILQSLGFTGSGNWSDPIFHEGGKLPYFYPMRGFPSTKISLFRDFPDVFSPEFSKSCNDYARQLEAKKDDPLMVGYFLGNEPHWAFGDYNLAREMLYKNDASFTRMKLIGWLKEKYDHNPYLLSAAWAYEFQGFGDLKYFILPHEKDISIKAEEDLKEFSKIMVEAYAETISYATRRADPNHLNLGLRFAWISSEACLIAGRYFDVFSLNGYTFPEPPETDLILEKLNKPVLIGEFHFGSIDMGLPATGIKGVKNQAERGKAYSHYVEHGFSRPEVVGIHYFQWNDQPLTGRFDGENYNIGIVDVTYRPYKKMARFIRKTNLKLLDIARGKINPYVKEARQIPAIYY